MKKGTVVIITIIVMCITVIIGQNIQKRIMTSPTPTAYDASKTSQDETLFNKYAGDFSFGLRDALILGLFVVVFIAIVYGIKRAQKVTTSDNSFLPKPTCKENFKKNIKKL